MFAEVRHESYRLPIDYYYQAFKVTHIQNSIFKILRKNEKHKSVILVYIKAMYQNIKIGLGCVTYILLGTFSSVCEMKYIFKS